MTDTWQQQMQEQMRVQRAQLPALRERLIGLTPEEARQIYPTLRVTCIDGNYPPVTSDFCTKRLNVSIVHGRIVSLDGFS